MSLQRAPSASWLLFFGPWWEHPSETKVTFATSKMNFAIVDAMTTDTIHIMQAADTPAPSFKPTLSL